MKHAQPTLPRLLTAVLLVGALSPGAARGAPAQNAPAQNAPAALAPLPAGADAAPEMNAFLEQDRKQMPPAGAVLFMGSSTIRLWTTMAQDIPEIPVINRGFGGSLIEDNTLYVDRIAVPYRPRMIVLFAGTNDLAYGHKTPPQVLQEFQSFVARVHAALPNTRIVYLSINPTLARWNQEADTLETNHLIEEWVFQNNSDALKLNYISTHEDLLTADGRPQADLLRDDHLHFNARGYRAWVALIKPRILALAAQEGVARRDAPPPP